MKYDIFWTNFKIFFLYILYEETYILYEWFTCVRNGYRYSPYQGYFRDYSTILLYIYPQISQLNVRQAHAFVLFVQYSYITVAFKLRQCITVTKMIALRRFRMASQVFARVYGILLSSKVISTWVHTLYGKLCAN